MLYDYIYPFLGRALGPVLRPPDKRCKSHLTNIEKTIATDHRGRSKRRDELVFGSGRVQQIWDEHAQNIHSEKGQNIEIMLRISGDQKVRILRSASSQWPRQDELLNKWLWDTELFKKPGNVLGIWIGAKGGHNLHLKYILTIYCKIIHLTYIKMQRRQIRAPSLLGEMATSLELLTLTCPIQPSMTQEIQRIVTTPRIRWIWQSLRMASTNTSSQMKVYPMEFFQRLSWFMTPLPPI